MTLKSLISTCGITLVLVGCGAGPQPEAKDEMNLAFENAKVTRAIYDSSGGDYQKVSEADKKKLIDLYKSDEGARKVFESIKNPPAGLGGSAPLPPGAQKPGN